MHLPHYSVDKYSSHTGRIFIISAPSGTGKTTLCNILCQRIAKLVYSVSYTTRAPRKKEVEGVDYYFVSEDNFIKGIYRNDWIEWTKVHSNFYGTPFLFLKDQIVAGNNVLLDIDVQGTECILRKYPDTITVFILPPSIEVLKERLLARGTDKFDSIKERLINAELEIEKRNMYQYVIVNDNLEKTLDNLIDIFHKEF